MAGGDTKVCRLGEAGMGDKPDVYKIERLRCGDIGCAGGITVAETPPSVGGKGTI